MNWFTSWSVSDWKLSHKVNECEIKLIILAKSSYQKYGSINSIDSAPSASGYFECSFIVVPFVWSEMSFDGDLY